MNEGDPDGLDMSMGGVPSEWFDAQDDSPIPYDDYAALTRPGRFGVLPIGAREGTFVANLTALIAGALSGGLWYFLDVFDIYSGPWPALAIGVIIAATVRATSKVMPAYASVLSVAFYLLTLFVVLILLTHRDLNQIYGSVDDFQTYESTLVRTRLQDPIHIGAYLLGGVLAAQVAYLQRPKH